MSSMRLACVQCDVRYDRPVENAEFAVAELRKLAEQGVDLAVFPEAFLTGYCAGSAEEAREIAIPRDHESIAQISSASNSLGISAIFGFAEASDGRVWNTAAFLQPGTSPEFYRKTHLPFLGMDRFATAGDRLPVFETPFGRIGILICFDLRPPEAARTLALKGADLLVLPTNWPEGAETTADHVIIARAAENRMFVASCDRVGEEKGFRFIGRSKIVSQTGTVLRAAGSEAETLVADLDLSLAREKRAVLIPGEYELEIMGCRNPALYGPVTSKVV